MKDFRQLTNDQLISILAKTSSNIFREGNTAAIKSKTRDFAVVEINQFRECKLSYWILYFEDRHYRIEFVTDKRSNNEAYDQ